MHLLSGLRYPNTLFFDMKILRFDELNSTQDKAAEIACYGMHKEGCFIVAKHQLIGRGRANTTWVGFEGCLMFSYVIYERQSMLNVLENIKKTLNKFGVCADVKWPNDVVLRDRKVCGVIIERHAMFDVVGIGVNLFGKTDYSTVDALTGIRICKDDFLTSYGKLYRDKCRADIKMSSLWFGNDVCKVKEMFDDCLVLETSQGEHVRISAQDYSYIKELNRVVRK
eukprot:jgi/Antlo1/420/908